MVGVPERLQVPQALTAIAKTELQRQEAFARAASLIWNIYFQKSDHTEVRDASYMTISRGATPAITVVLDGKELNLQVVDTMEYIHSPNKQYGWEDMGGLSLQLTDPSSKSQPTELARALRHGRGFVRRIGFETYEALDTNTEVLEGVVKLLEDYGRAVGYDPSIIRPVALGSPPIQVVA